MLSLLSLQNSAYVLYHLGNKQDWQLAFDPMKSKEIHDVEKERNKLWMYETFIKNAILADELPALKKAKGKAADKKLFGKLDTPDEFKEMLAQYDYWVTYEDLFSFIERPSALPLEYAHGRDALARLLCAIIDDSILTKNDQQSLIEHLEHKIESAGSNLIQGLKLGDNTLKGCCREISETYLSIKKRKSRKIIENF